MSRRERWLLVTAIGLGLAVRLAYVLATRHYRLAGDELEYDSEAQLIAHGHLFWTRLPYGIAHAGAWKAPGYPAWVGFWYALLGHHPVAVRLAQVPLGAVTIGLSWLLARRLFGARVATVAAFVVALYPLAWQYEELLYSESLATPLTLGVLIVIFTRPPSPRRALGCGLLLGVALAASVVFTSDSGTRYRATLEPVIAVLACAGALGAQAGLRGPPDPRAAD